MVVRAHQLGPRFLIGYIDDAGEVQPVKLNRREGEPPLFVCLWQDVAVVQEKKSFRLQTVAYNYRVSMTDGPFDEAVLRWEYVKVRQKGSSPYCRNHLQGTFEVPGSRLFDFKKMHLPTSYLTVEEFFRFLIVDLGHRPPCGSKWDSVLEESKKNFHEELSSKPAKYTVSSSAR